jgi:hypothetical protein
MTGTEEIEYLGHRLHVAPFMTGWRVSIYRPGSIIAETTVPQTLRPEQRDACIREAMQVVLKLLEK